MTRRSRSVLGFLAAAVSALAAGPSQAMTGGSVHAGFLGEWVPVSAACTSPLRKLAKIT